VPAKARLEDAMVGTARARVWAFRVCLKALLGMLPNENIRVCMHHIHIHTHMHNHICAYIPIYTCMYIHTYIHICTHICIYLYVHIHMCIYTYSHIYIYIYIYMHMCVYLSKVGIFWCILQRPGPVKVLGSPKRGLKDLFLEVIPDQHRPRSSKVRPTGLTLGGSWPVRVWDRPPKRVKRPFLRVCGELKPARFQ